MNLTNSLVLAGMSAYLLTTVVVCPLFTCRNSGPPPEPVQEDVSTPSDTGADADTGDVAGDVGGTDAADTSSSPDGRDCGADQTFVEDACIQCGAAGGCAEREARCVATCGELADCQRDDRVVPTSCRDGICRHICD